MYVPRLGPEQRQSPVAPQPPPAADAVKETQLLILMRCQFKWTSRSSMFWVLQQRSIRAG